MQRKHLRALGLISALQGRKEQIQGLLHQGPICTEERSFGVCQLSEEQNSSLSEKPQQLKE